MKINIKYATKPTKITSRVCEVAECFGLGIDESIEHVILEDYEFDESADVVYITGQVVVVRVHYYERLKLTIM